MVKLTCIICDEEYMGYDDSTAGVPNVCSVCDAEKADASEITLDNIPDYMDEHHALGRGDDEE